MTSKNFEENYKTFFRNEKVGIADTSACEKDEEEVQEFCLESVIEESIKCKIPWANTTSQCKAMRLFFIFYLTAFIFIVQSDNVVESLICMILHPNYQMITQIEES